jgi:hypothetical protein
MFMIFIQGTYCYYKNDYRLKFHHLVGLLMNMNDETQTDCHKKISEFVKDSKKKNSLDKIDYAMNECIFEGYGVYDFWRYVLDQLEGMVKKLKKKIDRMEKYISKREEKKMATFNGKLMLRYFTKKNELVNNIYDNIVKLKKRSLQDAERNQKNKKEKQDL